MSEIEYDPSDKSNLSFQVGAEILNFVVVIYRLNFFLCVINT